MPDLKLTDTHIKVLTAAAYRPDGNIEPLPPTLKGGARAKVVEGLTTRALIIEQDGKHVLTDAGYAAICRSRPQTETETETETAMDDAHNDAELEAAVTAAETAWQVAPKPATRRTRENSKQAQVVAMLQRPEGATVAQIMAATGWQAHTVRGTFAGAFKKKLGLAITSVKPEGGDRVYRAA